MPEGPIEAQLLDHEKQYWQAIKDRDVPAAMRLTDDPCIVVGAQGVARITRQAFAGMLQAGGWTTPYAAEETVAISHFPVSSSRISASISTRRDALAEARPL